MVVALAAPPKVTGDPAPLDAGLMVPEMVYVCGADTVAVKFWPPRLAPFTVALRLAGVKEKPLLLGVTA